MEDEQATTAANRTEVARVEMDEQLARTLGWVSLGLGSAQLLAPRTLNAIFGLPGDRTTSALQQLVALRELATGAGLLTGSRETQARWLWARAAGDAMDLALIGRAMLSPEAGRARLALTAAGVVGIGTVDAAAARRLSQPPSAEGEEVTKAITVARPVDDVYAFWRDFTNLPTFMDHVQSVEVTGNHTSRWTVRSPGGTTEWEAEIVEESPNERIAWRTLPGADVEHEGSVEFRNAPGDRGTEVSVRLRYAMPAGAVGRTVAKAMGMEPSQQIADDLRRFKQLMETGEIVRSDARPQGETHRGLMTQRSAQPLGAQAMPATTVASGGNQ